MKQELKTEGEQGQGIRHGYPRWWPRNCPNNHSTWQPHHSPLQRASAELPQYARPRPVASEETLLPTLISSRLRTCHSLFPQHSPAGTLGSSQTDGRAFPDRMSFNCFFPPCPCSGCGNLHAWVWITPSLALGDLWQIT